jgi:hypothetical protein
VKRLFKWLITYQERRIQQIERRLDKARIMLKETQAAYVRAYVVPNWKGESLEEQTERMKQSGAFK